LGRYSEDVTVGKQGCVLFIAERTYCRMTFDRSLRDYFRRRPQDEENYGY
jgi:hypothetical protein